MSNAAHAWPVGCVVEVNQEARRALDHSDILEASGYCLTKTGKSGSVTWYRYARLAQFVDKNGNLLDELQPVFVYVEIHTKSGNVQRGYQAKD